MTNEWSWSVTYNYILFISENYYSNNYNDNNNKIENKFTMAFVNNILFPFKDNQLK